MRAEEVIRWNEVYQIQWNNAM